ncbi:MAG: ATP-binding cassette domain-containing protein [Rhodospirillaceae bacterium]
MRDRDPLKVVPFSDDARAAHQGDAGKETVMLPLSTRGLTFVADGKALVSGVDLDISSAGVTVVMGPNGAGKSLLLRLLHGLIDPAAGSINWGGRPLDEDVRKRQAMVFQRPVLLRRSVAANIDFVLKLRGGKDDARRRDLLDLAGLAAQADQPARLLSGGEQQRLALARALATEPDVLFMDEPTANLDPASTLRIEEIVKQTSARGAKTMFITHDLGQARRLADDVVFMHRGRVLEHSTAQRFFTTPQSNEAGDYMAGKIVL